MNQNLPASVKRSPDDVPPSDGTRSRVSGTSAPQRLRNLMTLSVWPKLDFPNSATYDLLISSALRNGCSALFERRPISRATDTGPAVEKFEGFTGGVDTNSLRPRHPIRSFEYAQPGKNFGNIRRLGLVQTEHSRQVISRINSTRLKDLRERFCNDS